METFTIVYDTREHETEKLQQRLKSFGCPVVRKKLPFGDYSAFCTLPSGEIFSLEDRVCVERKEHFDELASCYTSQRARFTREFERAKEAGAKLYLLVEMASWEKAYSGIYKSKMTPQSLIGSMTTWFARYNCSPLFCQPDTTGKLIHDVLIKEMREALIHYDYVPAAKGSDHPGPVH